MTARLMIDLPGYVLNSDDRALLKRREIGGLILFSRNYRDGRQLQQLVDDVRDISPGILIAVDQEGGRIQRFRDGFHTLPALEKIGMLAERDEQQAIEASRCLAWLMAVELIRFGVDISFAPVLDLNTVQSQVIGDRSLGGDPQLVTRLAGAYVQGMHAAGMAATGKHFPGHGGVAEDSHLELPMDHRGLEEIWAQDLLPFRELSEQLDALMSAHTCFDQVDEQLVSFSSIWLREILRDRIGFKGRVFSDDLTMEGAAGVGSYRERARLALEAGCDMLVLCNNREGAVEVADWLAEQPHLEPLDWTKMRARRRWDGEAITDHPWYEDALEFLELTDVGN